MHFEKRRVVFLGLLVLVLLLGAGCKKEEASVPPQDSGQPVSDVSPPVQDSGPRIPEGWQWYVNDEGGYRIAYPPTWKVTEDGALYKDAPNLEEDFNAPWNIIESIARLAPASVAVAVFDPEGRSVDDLWEAGGARSGDIDQRMIIDGEQARLGICTAIQYMECLSVLHGGVAYSINMYTQGIGSSENPVLQQEVAQIINTFQFLR